jgi:hypothetical protein
MKQLIEKLPEIRIAVFQEKESKKSKIIVRNGYKINIIIFVSEHGGIPAVLR